VSGHGSGGWALLLTSLGLAVVVGLAFSASVTAPMTLSDQTSDLENPLVCSYRNVPGFFTRDFLMFSEGQFRPLGYAVLATVRGWVPADRLTFWHTWLVGVHWLTALLVFVVARRLLARAWPAAVAAGVYVLHPLASVVVNDVNEFHLLLGSLLYLGALACYLRRVDQPAPGPRARLAAWALFVAGVFASKVVFTLPILLLCYELLYRRAGLKRVLLHLSPYVVVVAVVWPFWWIWRAHPLHYRYAPYPAGGAWSSLAQTTSALAWYAKGLLLGGGIPAVLADVLREPANWTDWPVLLAAVEWGLIILVGLWALYRRSLLGVGLLIIFLGLVPFASVAWHQVPEVIAWSNLWFLTAGLALVVGALLAAAARRWGRRGYVTASVLCLLLVGGLGLRLLALNRTWADPLRYWERALAVHADSPRAAVALGRLYLAQNRRARALKSLFSEPVTDLSESAAAMALYYAQNDEPLAALVHLKAVGSTTSGIVYGRACVKAEVMEHLGVLDYAEASWGKLLVGNPYNTRGMKAVANVLARKGFVRGARRLLRHALQFNPTDPEALALLDGLKEREELTTPPPLPRALPPDWLLYSLSGETSVPLRKQLVALGRRLPDDPLIQAEAATALLEEGKPADTAAAMSRALQSLPRVATFWAVYALALDATGRHREAADALDESLRWAPYASEKAILYNLVAVVLLNRATNPTLNEPEAMDRAKVVLETALRSGPELAQVHANLGYILARQGNYKESLRHLRRAVAIEPTDVRCHTMLAEVLAERGNTASAREQYRQALTVDPTEVTAHLGLGKLLLDSGRLLEAERHLRRAAELRRGDPEILNCLGRLTVLQGNPTEAVEYFRTALHRSPYSEETALNLVETLKQLGRATEAVDELRRYVARTNSPLAAARLAWMLATSPDRQVRGAQEAVALAEGLCRQTGYREPRALVVLAAAYAEAGRFPEAVSRAREALQLAQASGQKELAADLREQLRLYEAGRPVRTSSTAGWRAPGVGSVSPRRR